MVAAAFSAARSTRSALSPATFFTSCSLPSPQELRDEVRELRHVFEPHGHSVMPSKSEPSPTASTPATSRMCSM